MCHIPLRARFGVVSLIVMVWSFSVSSGAAGQDTTKTTREDAQKSPSKIVGMLDWQIRERATGKLLDQKKTDVRSEEVTIEAHETPDGRVFYGKEIHLNAEFSVSLSEFPENRWEEYGGFGLVGSHRRIPTFCWEWFEIDLVIDSVGHATKLQETGELAITGEQGGSEWEIGRTEFLTDVVIRIDPATGPPDQEPIWLITIRKGSYVNWPSGQRAQESRPAPAASLVPATADGLTQAQIAEARSAAARYHEDEPTSLALEGHRLKDEDAVRLEQSVLLDPTNVTVRTVLLGYYFGKSIESKEMAAAHARHVLWLIDHVPTAPVLGTPFGEIEHVLNSKSHAEARALWLKQIETNSKDTRILSNAAAFFTLSDKKLSMSLLKRGAALEPRSEAWHDRLAFLHHLEKDTRQSLAEYEIAQKLDASTQGRFARLPSLAEAAFDAGEIDKARVYAMTLIERASPKEDTFPPYGDAIHSAKIILGRIALRSKDVARAAKLLVEAGKAAASEEPSFSVPALEFAAEVLKAGARDGVVDYLTLAKSFSRGDEEAFDRWIESITNGETPELDPFQ